jgi:hypothetical protein
VLLEWDHAYRAFGGLSALDWFQHEYFMSGGYQVKWEKEIVCFAFARLCDSFCLEIIEMQSRQENCLILLMTLRLLHVIFFSFRLFRPKFSLTSS